VLSHARALLTSTTAPTAYIDADARDTAKILAEAAELLDADEPYQLVADLMDAVPPGSFLAVTHPARDQVDIATKAEESLTESIGQKVTFRTREQVSRFFTGLELADPGVVPIQDWRPDYVLDLNSAPTAMWGGVGRKS
jgi:trans-aconitate methyltransferase